jgi:hypothetical protein
MGNLRNSFSVAIMLAAAGVALNAPQASAEIGTQVVLAGGGLGNGYGTGCDYLVLTTGGSGARQDFYDNGVWFGTTEGIPTPGPNPKTHGAKWTPATTGTHTILITENQDSKTIVLTVGTGINGGSSCLVI